MADVNSGPKKNRYKLKKTGTPAREALDSENRIVFSPATYGALIFLFVGMCLIQFGLVKAVLKQFSGLTYFFVLVITAFSVVSAIDYFAGKSGKESK